jgi:hypothetical protein
MPRTQTQTVLQLVQNPSVEYSQNMASPPSKRKIEAKESFRSANDRLRNLIPKSTSQLKIVIPEIKDCISVQATVSEVEKTIESFLGSISKSKSVDKSRMQMISSTVGKWLQASYPFATMILEVAKEGSAVLTEFKGVNDK